MPRSRKQAGGRQATEQNPESLCAAADDDDSTSVTDCARWFGVGIVRLIRDVQSVRRPLRRVGLVEQHGRCVVRTVKEIPFGQLACGRSKIDRSDGTARLGLGEVRRQRHLDRIPQPTVLGATSARPWRGGRMRGGSGPRCSRGSDPLSPHSRGRRPGGRACRLRRNRRTPRGGAVWGCRSRAGSGSAHAPPGIGPVPLRDRGRDGEEQRDHAHRHGERPPRHKVERTEDPDDRGESDQTGEHPAPTYDGWSRRHPGCRVRSQGGPGRGRSRRAWLRTSWQHPHQVVRTVVRHFRLIVENLPVAAQPRGHQVGSPRGHDRRIDQPSTHE